MTERITLRAKSDGTEISGVLLDEDNYGWGVALAYSTRNIFNKDQWDRIYTVPTKVGTIFRASVRGVENVRVMVADDADWEGNVYVTAGEVEGYQWHAAHDIDASTVVIELDGY